MEDEIFQEHPYPEDQEQEQEQIHDPQPFQEAEYEPNHDHNEISDTNNQNNHDNQGDHKPQQAAPVEHSPYVQHTSFFMKWGSLFVLGLALAIIIIDTTLLNVSLGTIIREFNTDIQSIQWVITAYSLTLAALTITGGRIGDLFGRKRMFMVGAVIFAIGSFVASISTSVPTLLLGESIIEGVGAALMMPATASLLVSNFQGKDRAVAFGVWGGIAGAASAIGPILGGYLTNNFSWRWGFRINVFVVLLLLAGSFIIKEAQDKRPKKKLDIPGILFSSVGLLGVVFGIIQSSTYGWLIPEDSPTLFGNTIEPFGYSVVPFSIVIGVIALVLFYFWERWTESRGNTPIVSFSIFMNRMFTAGVLTTAVISLGQVGLIFALPVFMQSVLKLDAFNTGLAMLPLSITLLLTAPLSGVLANKIPPKFLILTGLVLDVFAMFLLRASLSVDATIASLAPALIVFGMGMGMVMAQISNLTLSAVEVQQAGEASGVNNTFRQIGSSLGSAIIGAALLTALSTNLASGISGSTVIPPQYKQTFIQLVSKQTSNVEFGGGAKVNSTLPAPIINEITTISKQATVDAAKTSMLYAAAFAALGVLVALFLPNKKPEHTGPRVAGGH